MGRALHGRKRGSEAGQGRLKAGFLFGHDAQVFGRNLYVRTKKDMESMRVERRALARDDCDETKRAMDSCKGQAADVGTGGITNRAACSWRACMQEPFNIEISLSSYFFFSTLPFWICLSRPLGRAFTYVTWRCLSDPLTDDASPWPLFAQSIISCRAFPHPSPFSREKNPQLLAK